MTHAEAWSRLFKLASDEFSDAAARVQEGADSMGTVPEWAGLLAFLATGTNLPEAAPERTKKRVNIPTNHAAARANAGY